MDDPNDANQVIMDAINSDEMNNDSNFGSMKNESANIDDSLNINLDDGNSKGPKKPAGNSSNQSANLIAGQDFNNDMNNLNNYPNQEEDEVKPLRPIAKISNLFRNKASSKGAGPNQAGEGSHVQDMKWILNDTFLVIVTKDNEVLIFDALL